MAFPTSGYDVTEVEAHVTYSDPGWAAPQTTVLRFPRQWAGPGGIGISEACFEQAVTDAAAAFAAEIANEATIDSVTYAYSGRID